ncbi:MAG: signal peptide peptidase SppA [Phycisphaerae bacterium]
MTRQSCRWAAALFCALLVVAPDALAAKKVVRVVLDGAIPEAPLPEMDFSALFGGEKTRTLRQWTQMIHRAAKDSSISGMVLIIENPQLGFAQAEELRQAMSVFRATGKKIHCYIDHAGNREYLLASGADHITLAETSSLDITGIFAELSFYKGMLDKIGVQADMLHCGAYKSALEPYTRTEPSKENAEMINWLLDGLYARMTQLIAEGRSLTPEKVKEAIDNAPLEAKNALERKLVDTVSSFPEFRRMIQKEYGKDVELVKNYGDKAELKLDMSNPFAFFNLFQEMMAKASEDKKPGIALIYIDGAITVGRNEQGFMASGTGGSTTIRAAIEKALHDEAVKAVVLRVDSPGGSALGSDIMWEAATRLGKEKPLVVSMGNVAGSGGYYVSIPGDTIFADETTITGSIGVVGGKLVWNKLMTEFLGITSTEFTRGKRAAIMSSNRMWDDAERAWMSGYMNSVYEQFKGRVKASRGDRIKGDLEQLAGGRVYTGKQALERGLIDKIGTLDDAMKSAAGKANLSGDYEVYVLPKPPELADAFKKLMGEAEEDEWEIGVAPLANANPLIRAALPLLRELAPEKISGAVEGLRNLLIIDRERVGCFMPTGIGIR